MGKEEGSKAWLHEKTTARTSNWMQMVATFWPSKSFRWAWSVQDDNTKPPRRPQEVKKSRERKACPVLGQLGNRFRPRNQSKQRSKCRTPKKGPNRCAFKIAASGLIWPPNDTPTQTHTPNRTHSQKRSNFKAPRSLKTSLSVVSVAVSICISIFPHSSLSLSFSL